MVRVSYDYDLMTVLARHLWHLRDELDAASRTDKTFPASDIGPRRETAAALEDFYGAWRKSFREGWQAMTDLGDLLDRAGKAFYDQDASHAASGAVQVAATAREDARRRNEAHTQRLDGVRRGEKLKGLEAGYAIQQARWKKEQDAQREKQRELDERVAAQQKRQEDLNKESEALSERQAPLLRTQEELQQRQQRLWERRNELLAEREQKLLAKRTELQQEYDALHADQEPLLRRQRELQREQQEIWQEEKTLRAEQDAVLQGRTDALAAEQKVYDAEQDALQRRQNALWQERDSLLGRENVTQAEIDAWQRKQDALQQERDALWESEGKGLEQRWDALEQEQRDQQKAFDPLRERQRALDEERDALAVEQEPFTRRQDALLAKQKELWALERSTQQEVEDGAETAQWLLDAKRDEVQQDQEPLDKERQDLQTRQEGLWRDQADADTAQEGLRREEEPLRERQAEMQRDHAERRDELRDYKWDPDSGEGDPLMRRRDMADELGAPPSPPPKGYTIEDENSTTTVSYGLDDNGEVEVDRNGNPAETTTTVTSKNTGLSYSETYHPLSRDGDSVTTIRSSDGSVTKIYMDSSPEGEPDGTMKRYVTDGTGRDTLQIWTRRPGGDWELTMDKETYFSSEAGRQDDQQRLDRPPAYLTVENPLVDGDGRPPGSASAGETTRLDEGVTRTDYTGSDGSVVKVVTNENAGTRVVAGADNEIQEIWYRRRDGTWYLGDSVTQHERHGDEPSLGTLGGD